MPPKSSGLSLRFIADPNRMPSLLPKTENRNEPRAIIINGTVSCETVL